MEKTYIKNGGKILLELVCEVDSVPPSFIAISKEGLVIRNNTKNNNDNIATGRSGSEFLVVTISSPSDDNTGTYTCTANNRIGQQQDSTRVRGSMADIQNYRQNLHAFKAKLCFR